MLYPEFLLCHGIFDRAKIHNNLKVWYFTVKTLLHFLVTLVRMFALFDITGKSDIRNSSGVIDNLVNASQISMTRAIHVCAHFVKQTQPFRSIVRRSAMTCEFASSCVLRRLFPYPYRSPIVCFGTQFWDTCKNFMIPSISGCCDVRWIVCIAKFFSTLAPLRCVENSFLRPIVSRFQCLHSQSADPCDEYGKCAAEEKE